MIKDLDYKFEGIKDGTMDRLEDKLFNLKGDIDKLNVMKSSDIKKIYQQTNQVVTNEINPQTNTNKKNVNSNDNDNNKIINHSKTKTINENDSSNLTVNTKLNNQSNPNIINKTEQITTNV